MKTKIAVVLIILGFLVSGANAGSHFIKSFLPPAYEFNTQENPDSNYWCGHTALQSVGKYITGKYKRLDTLHYTFKRNSPSGYA